MGIAMQKHAADIQALNKNLYYNLIGIERTPATRTFICLVYKYNLVVHIITSLALQQVGDPKAPIHCTLTTSKDMVHSCKTVFGDSTDSYGGKIWEMPHSPPLYGNGQGKWAAPCI